MHFFHPKDYGAGRARTKAANSCGVALAWKNCSGIPGFVTIGERDGVLHDARWCEEGKDRYMPGKKRGGELVICWVSRTKGVQFLGMNNSRIKIRPAQGKG